MVKVGLRGLLTPMSVLEEAVPTSSHLAARSRKET